MPDLWNPQQRRRYCCRKVSDAFATDARLSHAQWQALPWTDSFVDITGDARRAPPLKTRVKMAWNQRYLFIGAELEEPHVWGTITTQNAVMFEDNDFEIFIDPDRDGLNYYEFEINALGTIWELSLPKPYADGGIPNLGCNVDGLISTVHVDGTVNDPSDIDRGWSVLVAIPWSGLAPYHSNGLSPPTAGDVWRVNFSRVQWQHEIVNGRYVRVPPHGTPIAESLNPEEQEHPENNWVWSPQGLINMHLPQRWGEIEFVDEP